MGLEMSTRVSEPVLLRWDEGPAEDLNEGQAGMDIFRLSGGVLGPTTRTSNRIDGLLGMMLVNQDSGKYLGDIDKNLDYLYTCLQLDLIERVANDVSSKGSVEEEEVVEEVPEPDISIPEPIISLDRVRPSV